MSGSRAKICYSRQEAAYELAEQGKGRILPELFASDPLLRRASLKRLAVRVPGRGLVYFLYSYLWRRGFLEGRDGLVLCLMRSMYQSMVAVKKYDKRRMTTSDGTTRSIWTAEEPDCELASVALRWSPNLTPNSRSLCQSAPE